MQGSHNRKSSYDLFTNLKEESQNEMVESVKANIKHRSKSCHDWRQYFQQEELESAY